MESRFGSDFSRIRVRETRDRATPTGAQAWALGDEITFARGLYRPGTPSGDRLLAHELAHTVQQSDSPTGGTVWSQTHPLLEHEADVAAHAVVTGSVAPTLCRGTGRRVQRQERTTPFAVVDEIAADDRNRRFLDPADGKLKPVWTPEGGYARNPSARPLNDALIKGKVGGGFENGRFPYVVDAKGEVIIARRLGEPGVGPGRATGMPHPTIIGGKNPTVLAAGEVEIRGGRIYRIDNQSGHFQPTRKAMGPTVRAFMRAPTSAFHPDFAAESVQYGPGGQRTTKPFRSISMLKLRARDLRSGLRGLRPRAIAGKMRGRTFRAGAKSAAGGIVGLIVMLVLEHVANKLTEKVYSQFIDKQIEDLSPQVEERLMQQGEELDKLLEADAEAELFVNLRISVAYPQTRSSDGMWMEIPPVVHLVDVGFSRQPWSPAPIETTDVSCMARVERTVYTVSEAVNTKELFLNEPVPEAPGNAEQPATR